LRELTFVKSGRVEWRSVEEPRLEGAKEALVRPVIAARCDGDNLPLFNEVTTALRAGVALHYLDPLTTDLLGPYPYRGPFAIGHECIAEVVECGETVHGVRPGHLVVVPWAISCGTCGNCGGGLTSRCSGAGETLLSAYGFGPSMGPWGGAVCDLLRVPFADAMLVPVPDGVNPLSLASASDNLPDAWRAVGPWLAKRPGTPVLIVGGGARSIGLYAAGMAVALGAARVDYVDHDPERLAIAESLGACAIESRPGKGWFGRHAPRVHGEFGIAVEASSTAAGLRYALRSLSPGGVCTAVGYYFANSTGLPLLQMFTNSTTLKIGVSHARADLPAVVELIAKGSFEPLKVATLIADWDDAPEAFTTRTTKVIVRRANFGRVDSNGTQQLGQVKAAQSGLSGR
jgi:threonine dehydrogenase-like Zn-dependent dehydrogenase